MTTPISIPGRTTEFCAHLGDGHQDIDNQTSLQLELGTYLRTKVQDQENARWIPKQFN